MQQVYALTEKEKSELPKGANNVLETIKDAITEEEYNSFAKVMYEVVVNKKSISNINAKYDNPNIVKSTTIFNEVGEYNPDKIPIRTYEKMRKHPQIAIAESLITLPIIAQNFRIESTSKKNKEFVSEAISPIYRDTVKDLLKAVPFGFTAGEKVWDVKDFDIIEISEEGRERVIFKRKAAYIKKIKFMYPSSVSIIRDKFEDIKSVKQRQSGTDFKPRKEIPISDIVWFALEAEYGNFFGKSRLQNAYQPWYWVQILTQFILKYMERKGSPTTIAWVPPGFSNTPSGKRIDNMDLGLNIARSATSNSVASIPLDYDKNGKKKWDLTYLEDSQRSDMFIDALKFFNTQINRALFIPDKVATAEGSSTNATAESHTDVHLLNEEALIQEIENIFNNQIIPQLIEYNFKPTQRRKCTIKIERLNFTRKNTVKDILLRMLMLSGSAMRDGNTPKYLPSIKSMLDFLEVPGDVFGNIFDEEEIEDNGGDDGNEDEAQVPDNKDKSKDSGVSDKDKTIIDDEQTKKQKKDDANSEAVKPKERTRRDRRSKERK